MICHNAKQICWHVATPFFITYKSWVAQGGNSRQYELQYWVTANSHKRMTIYVDKHIFIFYLVSNLPKGIVYVFSFMNSLVGGVYKILYELLN